MLQEQQLLVLSTPSDKEPLPAASKYQECSLDTSQRPRVTKPDSQHLGEDTYTRIFTQEKILSFLNFCLKAEQEGSISEFPPDFLQISGKKNFDQCNLM